VVTTLNVKVGAKVTFKLPVEVDGVQTTQDVDGEIVDFPKIARVKTADGQIHTINMDQIVAEEAKAAPRFGSKFQPRLGR
jgi:hypothetical protein